MAMKVPITTHLYNLFIPIHCSLCGHFIVYRHPLCKTCLAKVQPIAPVDMAITRNRSISLAAAAAYDTMIAWHVTGKHRGDVASAQELGWLIAHRCSSFIRQADTIIPIPLHWKRYAWRGFDQTEIIAKRVSKEMRMSMRSAITRVHWHSSQAGKSRKEREENVVHAFSVIDQKAVAGHHVLLLDDVASSGATIAEAARLLYAHKAASVRAVVAARSV